MNDSFDDELQRSLRSHADQVPRRPDLSRGAIERARGIRRRRRVAGVVAAAALVAVAVPVGLRVGDVMSDGQEPVAPPPPTPTGPVNVELDLRELPEGDPPSIPYLDETTFVGDGEEIDVSDSGNPVGIAPVTDGAYVTGDWTTGGWPLTKYTFDGGTEDLGPVQSTPVASADGRWLAYVTRPGTLVLRDENGEESTVELDGADASSVDVHAIVDGTVYFTYYLRANGRNVPLQAWSGGDAAAEPVAGDINATAVSRDGNLVARLDFVNDFRSCATIANRSTGDETPKRCGTFFSIKGFSPDGRYAWADNAEGLGASEVSILDTQTGEIVRKYTWASQRHAITFSDTMFEDDDSLLIQAQQDGQTALLRCDFMGGDCELATPPADGTFESPSGPPYLLPQIR